MSLGRYQRGNAALGLLVLRLVLGTVLFLNGIAQVTGLFGGPGLEAYAASFAAQGLEPSQVLAGVSAGLNMLAGALVLVGLFTTEACLAIAALMMAGIFREHLFQQIPSSPERWGEVLLGARWQLTALAVAVALALTGPGAVSLDSGRFITFSGRKRK